MNDIAEPSKRSKRISSSVPMERPPLYVYDRVSTKGEMVYRMSHTTRRPSNSGNLSGAYKKQAHIQSQAEGYLRDFYQMQKQSPSRPRYMGLVEDEAVWQARMQEKARSAAYAQATQRPHDAAPKTKRDANEPFAETRYFPPKAHRHYAADSAYQKTNATRHGAETIVFSTPVGGEAVKRRRGLWDSIFGGFHFFDDLDTAGRQRQKEVDAARKQALLHKKLQEHRRGLTLALSILAIFFLCCMGIYHLLFVVRQVEVSGSMRYGAEEVIAVTGLDTTDADVHLYDFSAEEIADRITFYCPYIRQATLTRQLPTTVSLVLEDDEVYYCANIFGQIVALSPGLRVLGTLTTEEAADYILLRLPGVAEAVAGRTLVFADARHERYIRQVLSEIDSSALHGRVSYIDLRDEHDLYLHCDDMYEMQLGNTADLKIKLRMADKAVADVLFPQNTPARVDLRVVGEASVMADLRLDLSETP